MIDICEATQLSGEEELEVSKKSSPTRPFLDQRIILVVVVVFHHWLELGVGQSPHHLMKMSVVVEVLGSMKDFWIERVVVVVSHINCSIAYFYFLVTNMLALGEPLEKRRDHDRTL